MGAGGQNYQLYGPAGAQPPSGGGGGGYSGQGVTTAPYGYGANSGGSQGGGPPGLFFNSPGEGLGAYGPAQNSKTGVHNMVPTGVQGAQGTTFNPNQPMNQPHGVNNQWAGDYSSGNSGFMPGGNVSPFSAGGGAFPGFSYINPYLLGPYQGVWGNAMSPMGISNAWASGGYNGVPSPSGKVM